PQEGFVECRHGDGHAQAAGEARRFVDRTHGVGSSAGASVLPEAERGAGGGGLRRVCGKPLREVLCEKVRASVADARHLFSFAADRLFRGHRRRAWHRLADSLALRRFVGIALDEYTPGHSTISRTRRLIDLDTHREVFAWVLGVL